MAENNHIEIAIKLFVCFRYHLNIAGIENYRNLQDVLPHCWSEPSLGNILRRELEPPILQRAAFDDTVRIVVYNIRIQLIWGLFLDILHGHNKKYKCT